MEWVDKMKQDPATCDACGERIARLRRGDGGFHSSDPVERYSLSPFLYCSADCRELWEMEEKTIAFRAEAAQKQEKQQREKATRQAAEEERQERIRNFSVRFTEPTEESFQSTLEEALRGQLDCEDYNPREILNSDRVIYFTFNAIAQTGTIYVEYFRSERRSNRLLVRYFDVLSPSGKRNPRWYWKENLMLLEFRLEERDRPPQVVGEYRTTPFGSIFDR